MRDRADSGLSALAAEAREGSRAARVRVGVGAGVILLLVGLVVAVVVTTLAPRGGIRSVDSPSTGTAAPGTDESRSGGAASGAAGGASSAPASVLLVHVLGAVTKPGIVELRAGARVVDAIAAAGGLTADANSGGVNLARPVSDGEQLIVPREGEVIGTGPGPGGSSGSGPVQPGSTASSLVNVNLASVPELETLPRIGPALAQRIVDWRDAHGPFVVAADLMKVSGIGQTLFDGLKDLITL